MPMCMSLSTTIARESAVCGRDSWFAPIEGSAASSASSRAATKPATPGFHGLSTSRPAGEGEADDFAVVADDDVAVGVGGVGPEHVGQLPAANVGMRRTDQAGAADFLETLRRQLRHHQLAAVVVDEVPI